MLNHWQSERWRGGDSTLHCAIPGALRPWLFERHSLTHKLRAHYAGQVRVRLLSHAWGAVSPAERRALAMGPRERGFVRQVELLCGGRPVIYARTVVPAATVAARRRLTRLGTRALGDMLFADRSMRRGEVTVARLPQGHRLLSGCAAPDRPVWGRRSVFTLGHAPLLVSEFFLEIPK